MFKNKPNCDPERKKSDSNFAITGRLLARSSSRASSGSKFEKTIGSKSTFPDSGKKKSEASEILLWGSTVRRIAFGKELVIAAHMGPIKVRGTHTSN
ncbi:hypothetical protein RUND412_002709 [Rhizina undulata]